MQLFMTLDRKLALYFGWSHAAVHDLRQSLPYTLGVLMQLLMTLDRKLALYFGWSHVAVHDLRQKACPILWVVSCGCS